MSTARHSRGNTTGMNLMVGFQGTTLEAELKGIIRDFHIGGIVLFRRNIESPGQLRALLQEAQAYSRQVMGRPLWVAIDQEGGPVQRLRPPFAQLPSAQSLADSGPETLVAWCRTAALELRQLGIQINLAPVLDVVRDPSSHFMAERSLGSNPEKVSQLGALWIRTLQEEGVAATAKHFPGLGRANLDPHHFAPVIRWESETAMAEDLLPFETAIKAGVHCVMTSHARYPDQDEAWPATFSPRINHDCLRRRLGFGGVLLSDDLDMAAVSMNLSFEEMARQGLRSTLDFFLLCQASEHIEAFYGALRQAVAGDRSLADLHNRSILRIEALQKHFQARERD